MHRYAHAPHALLWMVCVGLGSGCDGEMEQTPVDARTCPAGPAAPLGAHCETPGLVCKYGYQSQACGGRTVTCRRSTWVEVEHTDPSDACDAGTPDGGRAARALSLTDLTRVTVSRFYCGAVLSSCGGGLGPTIDYTVDLSSSTLTTRRCTPSDAGPAGRPQTSLAIGAEQLLEIRAALASVRVADAEIMGFDGMMQALTLTYADGTTRRYSPAAVCGERRYEQVVTGFGALWDRISSLDPQP